MSKKAGIDSFRRDAWIWTTVGGFLQSANVILGLVAVLLTSTVAAKPFGLDAPYPFLSYLAAIATAALTFVRAEHRGRAWSQAGRRLEDEIALFDIQPDYALERMIDARKEAVKMTAEGYPQV